MLEDRVEDDVLVQLGCAMDDDGWVVRGLSGATSVPGVWVAGNATDLMAQVSGAAADAARVAAQIHGDLLMTDLQVTRAARGATVSA